MTIKKEASKILENRKTWGDIWDEYSDITHIDIIIGKIQRAYNLLVDNNSAKAKEELIDGYNYALHLKKRYRSMKEDTSEW